MGRKVHPIGFRLGINKTLGQPLVREGKEYASQLHQDFAIRRLILKECDQMQPSRGWRSSATTTWCASSCFTAKPGVFIGRKGATVKELRQHLEKLSGCKVDLKVVGDRAAGPGSIARGGQYCPPTRAAHRPQPGDEAGGSSAMRQGAQGIKVMCAGRLSGSEMRRTEWMRDGRVPLQWLRADVDFARTEALTTYGRIGVKVWIYRGEARPEAERRTCRRPKAPTSASSRAPRGGPPGRAAM